MRPRAAPATIARPRDDTYPAPPTGTLASAPAISGGGSVRQAAVSRTPRRSCAKIETLADTPLPTSATRRTLTCPRLQRRRRSDLRVIPSCSVDAYAGTSGLSATRVVRDSPMASKTLCARSTVMPWYSFRSSRDTWASLISSFWARFLVSGLDHHFLADPRLRDHLFRVRGVGPLPVHHLRTAVLPSRPYSLVL